MATPAHLAAFTERLAAAGFDVEPLYRQGQLTILDAADTLGRFMVSGARDCEHFAPLIGDSIDRAGDRLSLTLRPF